MGTRSNIYVETKPGAYLGTYCHYDGYPKHMHTALERMGHDKLLGHILVAMTQGGFRTIGIDHHGDTEYLEYSNTPCILLNPDDEDCGPDYVYIKCLDGKIKWRASHGSIEGGVVRWNVGRP